MKRLVFAALAALVLSSPAVAGDALGQFNQKTDIGAPPAKGSATFDAKTGTYRITGGGKDIWAGADDFYLVSQRAQGDQTIAATVAWVAGNTDPHSKAGVMIRQSAAADSPYADVVVHQNGHVAIQIREVTGGPTYEIQAIQPGPGRLQLERQGDYVYMSVAGPDGVLRHAGGGFKLKLDGPYLIGLAVCAHSDTGTKTVDFSDVQLAATAPLPVVTPQTKTESTLETLEVATGFRLVVYHTTDHIEAPNWLPDGKTLLFNSAGHLFTLPLDTHTPALLDTGTRNMLNNDHGLSPDGRWLAISDQTRDDHQSRVYVLPLTGGEPRLITEQAPSYWHGWSPDGKTLAVIANRNGDYDVYGIPAAGGPETRLTTTPGLDDGSDYSPDGQWIWFNSVRSGNMKIWRMHADGSGAEQMTFGDDSRDWFPHPSPDGKWIAFVSFGTDVTVGDHPANKDVTIRIMPATGGPAVVVARLFGGQGTMNVPSWSPDSTHLAFVSYRPAP